jgi:membrane protein
MINALWLMRLRKRLWEDRDVVSRSETWLIRIGRHVFALGRDLLQGELSMRAMSLVYTTLLSLVPLLALGFSVLKALGVHNMLEPMLLEFLRPLGPQATEVTANLIGFVEKIQVGVLGSLGIALLFYTAVSLIRKVEASFNFIWRIERTRPFAQRVGEYLGVLMVGPVIVFSAIGVTTSIFNSSVVGQIGEIEVLGFAVYLAKRLVPYALIVGMFTFLYAFMPNTRVRLSAAAVGGLTAGVLWQTASLVFASFVAGASNYNAIYSGFAIFLFLLIWLYLGWLILLVGCQLSFYVQQPEHLKEVRTAPVMSGRQGEYLALLIMQLAGRRYIAGEPGLTQDEFARQLRAQPEHVARAVETLLQCRFLTEAGRARTELIPARDLDSVTLGELWRTVRSGTIDLRPRDEAGRGVLRMIEEAEGRFCDTAGSITLRRWLTEGSS